MSSTTEIPSYKAEQKGLVANLESMLPPDALTIFGADAQQLAITHTSPLKLKVGEKAPDFTLPNTLGQQVSLSSLLVQGSVVLSFYRGTWCPYCNLVLNGYQRILDKIKAKGANLVAISPQTPDHSLSIKEKNELQFEVLSDTGNQVAKQYTAVFKNADVPVATMESLGINFHSFYGNQSGELPVPAVFIINQQGVVTFAATEGGDYRERVEAQEILNALN